MKKTIIILLGAALAFAWSCSPFNEAHTTEVQELAFNLKKLDVASAEEGEIQIPVYTNGRVNVNFVEPVDWAHLNTGSFEGDIQLTVSIDKNTGMRRMAKLALELEGTELKDTICLKQEGIQAYLECSAPYVAISGAENCDLEFKLTTNVECAKITSKVEYLIGEEGWMGDVVMKDYSPTKMGSGKVVVKAVGGGTELGGGDNVGGMALTREVSIISRSIKSSNQGWL